jgi:hypothetical protein
MLYLNSNSIFASILIIILFNKNVSTSNDENSKTFMVKHSNSDGVEVQTNLLEFIEQGTQKMSHTIQIKNKVLMVLGLSGTGKSTLVNYLNDVPLVCVKRNFKWQLELESDASSLPGGFEIGHKSNSKTLFPSAYSPIDKDFSYIDNPGFQDNRGIGVEIANGFFREKIIEKANELKFLILVKHDDLIDRGQQLRDSVKRFADFLGIFDGDKQILNNLSKTIGLIVSRVDNDGETDIDMIKMFKKRITEILIGAKKSDEIRENEAYVFEQLILNDQIDIFSNPKKYMRVDKIQSERILNLIQRLNYIKKEDAKIRVTIDRSYMPKLDSFIKDRFEKFTQTLENILEISITNYINSLLIKDLELSNFLEIKGLLNFLNTSSYTKLEFDFLLNNLNENFLSSIDKRKLSNEKQILFFFVKILPEENRRGLSNEQNWISSQLNFKFSRLIEKFKEHVTNEQNEFENNVYQIVESSIKTNYINELRVANTSEDVKSIENYFIELKHKIKEDVKIEEIDGINSINKDRLIHQKLNLEPYVDLLSHQDKLRIKERKNKKHNNLIKIVDTFLKNMETYLKINPPTLDSNGFLTFIGHFSRISHILNLINNFSGSKNKLIKNIKILISHSLIIDYDFKISKDTYEKHTPDVIIISPKIIIEKPVVFNLTCENSPQFFKNSELSTRVLPKKYNDNLPGYNGGNLILLGDDIINSNNIHFISQGSLGKSGLGQAGKICTFKIKSKSNN